MRGSENDLFPSKMKRQTHHGTLTLKVTLHIAMTASHGREGFLTGRNAKLVNPQYFTPIILSLHKAFVPTETVCLLTAPRSRSTQGSSKRFEVDLSSQ